MLNKNIRKYAAAGIGILCLQTAFAGTVCSCTEKKETVSEEKMTETETEILKEEKYPLEGPALSDYETYLADREKMGEKWSAAIEDLGSGKKYGYQADQKMQSASVIKVFIMGAVYDRICYPTGKEPAIAYTESYPGELRSILEKMIRVSDNDCANAAIRILGEGDAKAGEEVVNDFCKKHGYEQTHAGRLFLESNPSDDNYTSAGDCCQILSDIYNGKLVCEDASKKMLDILKGQNYKWKIPAGLPAGYTSANKTGEMPEGYGLGCIENDIAIVFAPSGDYVLALMSNELGGRNEEVKALYPKISQNTALYMEAAANDGR